MPSNEGKKEKFLPTFICSELSHKHIFVPSLYLKIDNLEKVRKGLEMVCGTKVAPTGKPWLKFEV